MKPNVKQAGARMRRRSFLKGMLTAGAASVFAPRLLLSGSSSGKVNLACCGIGNRGTEDVKGLYATGLANIVALCDTDMGAPHTQAVLKQFPNVPRFQDFRQMFDKMGKDIEAVSVAVRISRIFRLPCWRCRWVNTFTARSRWVTVSGRSS